MTKPWNGWVECTPFIEIYRQVGPDQLQILRVLHDARCTAMVASQLVLLVTHLVNFGEPTEGEKHD
jgi:hypothetical protein